MASWQTPYTLLIGTFTYFIHFTHWHLDIVYIFFSLASSHSPYILLIGILTVHTFYSLTPCHSRHINISNTFYSLAHDRVIYHLDGPHSTHCHEIIHTTCWHLNAFWLLSHWHFDTVHTFYSLTLWPSPYILLTDTLM